MMVVSWRHSPLMLAVALMAACKAEPPAQGGAVEGHAPATKTELSPETTPEGTPPANVTPVGPKLGDPIPADPPPAPTGVESGPASPEIVSAARTIQGDVACIRGLPFEQDPAVEFQSLADFGTYLDAQLEKEFGDEDGEREARLLHALRIVDPAVDIYATLRKATLEQAAAYYDPEKDAFYVVQDMPAIALNSVMAHELQHAIQDQHTDLMDAYLEGEFDTLDESLAARFIVEGEATVVGNTWLLRDMGKKIPALAMDVCHLPGDKQDLTEKDAFWGGAKKMLVDASKQTRKQIENPGMLASLATRMMSKSIHDSMIKMRELPNFFFYSMLWPYNKGALTVFTPFEAAGYDWAVVDELFNNPPQTCEQSLHPEKLVGTREAFTKPELEPLAQSPFRNATGWNDDGENRIGELATFVWLVEGGVEESVAVEAAAGWNGDSVRVYTKSRDGKDDALAYAWALAFDSGDDLTDFRTRVAGVLDKQLPEVSFSTSPGAAANHPRKLDGRLEFSWSEDGMKRHGVMTWSPSDIRLWVGFDAEPTAE